MGPLTGRLGGMLWRKFVWGQSGVIPCFPRLFSFFLGDRDQGIFYALA